MKRIEELTAKQKYEILIWADENEDEEYLCDKIHLSMNRLGLKINYKLHDIWEQFHMLQFRPKGRAVFWWVEGSPKRKKAWKKLIEYWKEKAENDPA
jgi:hypothetical protein